MGAETAGLADVHVHAQCTDQGPKTGNPWDFEPKTARTPVSRDARVIPIRPDHRQGDQPDEIQASEPAPSKPRGGEFEAAAKLLTEQAVDGGWDREPMTPLEAFKTITPAKGEASNWIIWSGMTLAGLARVLIVTAGTVIVRGGDTRIKAGAVSGVLLIALTIAYLAGHSA